MLLNNSKVFELEIKGKSKCVNINRLKPENFESIHCSETPESNTPSSSPKV